MRSVVTAMIMLLSACGEGGSPAPKPTATISPTPTPTPTPTTPVSDWYKPSAGIAWQWQLSGALNTSYDVPVYDIDLFDTSPATIQALQARDIRVMCYFSAGSWENFRSDAGQFAATELGNIFEDFPDERWLDIRTENVRRIMRERLDVARQKRCDGVEPDNVDGFDNNTGFPLTAADQLAYNRFLADEAHRRGLSVGLKNDLAQIPDLVSHFDFAVNEQCFEYDECEDLKPFIDANKPVFHAEYEARFRNDPAERARLCARSKQLGLSTLILPINLDDSFRITCD